MCYPNSGEAYDITTQTVCEHGSAVWRAPTAQDVHEPAAFAAMSIAWAEAGAQVIGGCCRIGPAEISALHRAIPFAAESASC